MCRSLPVSIVRGGTSKGVFIEDRYLPTDKKARDAVILRIFGSPDVRQIDGLGGADILTSKLAIIGKPTREDADIDYTFGQVSIANPVVDYQGNCGNISAGVAAYAVEKGYVVVKPNTTLQTVRIHMVNTGRMLVATVPVNNGERERTGDYEIAGVPGTHARIDLNWADCGGETTGKLLPTGNVVDRVVCSDGDYQVTVVDAGNVTVFIDAHQLGLTGIEAPKAIESDKLLMDKIEEIRGRVAEKIGLISSYQNSIQESPYTPFFSIVSHQQAYTGINGNNVEVDDIDLVSRLAFMQGVHKAHPVSGTVALGVASTLKNTVVNRLLPEHFNGANTLRIGHPTGVIEISSETAFGEGGYELIKSNIGRTARIILDGNVYI